MINDFFNWCVLVLEIMAEHTGMSYELINILCEQISFKQIS